MKNKAVFFDRDGIINEKLPDTYINEPKQLTIFPEMFDILKYVKEQFWLAIIITNQKGIGKGLMTERELTEVHNYLQNTFMDKCGYKFDDIYYCTDPEYTKDSKLKPNPSMILEAAEKWNIDLENSIMIGDRDIDIQAGHNAGLKTILLGVFEDIDVIPSDYIALGISSIPQILKRILQKEDNDDNDE